jgi:hypothetical protein
MVLVFILCMWCVLVFMRGVVLVLKCLLVFLVLVILCLFLGCRLVSVVCLVVARLEELPMQTVQPFGLNMQWGVWSGLLVVQGHPIVQKGRLHGVCGRLSWPGGGGEEQLEQLVDFHSLDRLGPELVLVGGKAGLVQLARPRLVQLQLDVGAQGCAHVVVGHHRQLVQLRLAQLVQLLLDVQAHLDGVGAQRWKKLCNLAT